MDKKRAHPRGARQVVDSIFEAVSANAKQSYCKFLGSSIVYLAQHYPDRWGVTLLEDRRTVRLNAGMGVECLILNPGWLRVLVDKEKAPKRVSFDGRIYANAPGCETVAIGLSEIPHVLPKIAEAHHKAIETVAERRRPFRNILNAHSTDVTRWLSQVLQREVPNPKRPSRALHIVQGGIENGDKTLLERLARGRGRTNSWVVPKSVAPRDEVVIYIRGFGFFAIARIASQAKVRDDWNRYGAGLDSIRLIQPPISLSAIRRHIPKLEWAKYPRSITSPPPEIADQVRALISARGAGNIDMDDEFLAEANIYELRRVALLTARRSLPPKQRVAIHRARSAAIRYYVLRRANGRCEGCLDDAPFRSIDGKPFLETHHTSRVADGGPDHPSRVIGLCPNCHRRAHLAEDARSFNMSLIRKLPKLEAEIGSKRHKIGKLIK